MSDVLREAVLIAATLTTGLMAGVFGIYSNAIMPGLRRTDDRTFVTAFQSIDRAIVNPAFVATFLGALALTALAALLHITAEGRVLVPWIVTALVLYLFVFVITIRVHVPRNNEIKAAGDVDHLADPHGVRERFDEATWARWNHVRAFASILAFGLLALGPHRVRTGALRLIGDAWEHSQLNPVDCE
jgi:uncharacterized membrane protein